MKTLKRNCWLCNRKLMAVSHAEVVIPDGNVVWVHKGCEKDTRAYFHKETASVGQPTPNLSEQFYDES